MLFSSFEKWKLTVSIKILLIFGLNLLDLSVVHAQPLDDQQRNVQEAQTRQKLEQIRSEIKAVNTAADGVRSQRTDALKAVHEQELKLAVIAKELHTLDQKIIVQQDELEKWEVRRAQLMDKLNVQRDALAALLRSAYALGQHQELKLLLAQDNIGSISRVLAYHRYFQQARVTQIESLLQGLAQLTEIQNTIEQQTTVLKTTREARVLQAQELQNAREQHEKLLASLELTLKDQQSRLAALNKDEKVLMELLEKLRDVFADIPQNLVGAEPFEQLRGRLGWPLRGALKTVFGASDETGHTSLGLMIASNPGSEVHAISHGRVAFADWLRGFGLLLIVDHGDGYLSLYGCNETLLKDVGDWVNSNEVIATSGASGGRKTPGLYFELRYQGKPLDPRAWLNSSAR